MCLKKSKIGLLLLVLLVVSVPLFALPTRFVGIDSRDAKINNQSERIASLEMQIAEYEVEVVLKASEIKSLQESLRIVLTESDGLEKDSIELLKLVSELESQLKIAQTEHQTLEISLDESKEELIESETLVTVATEIVKETPAPNKLGGSFALNGMYNLDGTIDAGFDIGLTYSNYGLSIGIMSEVDSDMYLPSEWTYKASLQVFF